MSAGSNPATRPTQKVVNTRYRIAPLSRECARRQGLITNLAFVLLGGRAQAISYLNTPDLTSGASPLDQATQNDVGYLAVEKAIRQLACAGGAGR